ncbi:hypothetical protein [Paractinoplanes atraurantiacus]|uniref:Uncharacterized protein n=1 Tax=Paractinoplanes atraurantiacus TaxID=1036182 RepID=A0A285H0F4_9ACTN|nr:hypothetical protein [Actinoplanes atraurantiacus]SNY29043.1 hypothetical protein SAMN05421748_103182 [Actinoplanes atraurantiacus]
MEISVVKKALADAVRAAGIDIPRAGKLSCYSHSPAAPNVPAFTCGQVAVDPLGTFGQGNGPGLETLDITCAVLTSAADDDAGQRLLDKLISKDGPYSIRQALIAARGEPGQLALGGVAHDVWVQRIDGYRMLSYGGEDANYYGADVLVRVIGD